MEGVSEGGLRSMLPGNRGHINQFSNWTSSDEPNFSKRHGPVKRSFHLSMSRKRALESYSSNEAMGTNWEMRTQPSIYILVGVIRELHLHSSHAAFSELEMSPLVRLSTRTDFPEE